MDKCPPSLCKCGDGMHSSKSILLLQLPPTHMLLLLLLWVPQSLAVAHGGSMANGVKIL